ncbi:FAD-dependent oxidoreductase [Halomontanus rarus]|uniref:FAD-dependent oxidoreductase n=1 Tax=Halomontanus rarus TaxID=3034020 RepID=UPI0023E78B77|nr:FAD-dependent oxidoreductase [Halovivax sp. TS33]
METDQVESIIVVGGGDAGLLNALALEKGLAKADITVIDNFEDPIPEVGKSTLLTLARFLHQSLDIDQRRMLSEVKLAWKTTVHLKDWCGREFYSPLGAEIPRSEQTSPVLLDQNHEREFQEFYYRYQQGNFDTIYGEVAEHPGKTALIVSKDDPTSMSKALPDAAYQFDTRSFNRFLRKVCRERGVTLVNDRITDVQTEDGGIASVASDEAEYTADLYVDATGFKRLLMNELDNEFREYDLPVDSAVVTQTDIDLSDIVSATVVTTGEAGWFWQIDTLEVRDLGYVYSSSHISDDDAKRELIEHREEDIADNEFSQYRFDSGVLEEPWLENCVAAGNAVGFVEPLQSTALTTAGIMAERLGRMLAKHGRVNHQGLRDLYNESALATWDEVYNFISLYYVFNSGSTDFWRDARQINPDGIPQHETYQESGFAAPTDRFRLTRTDADLNEYFLYHLILHELGVKSAFFESVDVDVDPTVVDAVETYTANLSDRVEQLLSYEEFYRRYPTNFD